LRIVIVDFDTIDQLLVI